MSEAEIYRSLINCLDIMQERAAHDVADLCEQAITPYGPVASASVFPGSVSQAKALLDNISLSALVNFPDGGEKTLELERETEQVLAAGANEVSHMMPAKAFEEGRPGFAEAQMGRVRRICGSIPYKVILATDILQDADVIRHAATVALDAGADWLALSGLCARQLKREDIIAIVLSVLQEYRASAGIHVMGSMASASDALAMYQMVQKPFDMATPDSKRLRLSGPGLRAALVQAVADEGGSA